ncbi:hypothetical protein SALB1_3730 [Salinisphaera sp. LB1]|nr:hypothetical protein SALB1_3730 [Salinisphaera sp. LB1]
MEHAAFLDRTTGAIYWQSDNADVSDELPEHIDDADRYITIPYKNDLGLGKPLAMAFARKYLPEGFEQVRAIFNQSDACAHFKALLIHQDGLTRGRPMSKTGRSLSFARGAPITVSRWKTRPAVYYVMRTGRIAPNR